LRNVDRERVQEGDGMATQDEQGPSTIQASAMAPSSACVVDKPETTSTLVSWEVSVFTATAPGLEGNLCAAAHVADTVN
jgi:hypothetical protein